MSHGEDGDAAETLKRAGARAVYHLLRAGVESLKAVEAVLDELGRVRREGRASVDEPIRQRIDLE